MIIRRDEPDGGHTYWSGEEQWPGITTVLSGLGYNGRGQDFYTPESRQKGTGVHNACLLADQLVPDAKRIEEVLEVIDMHPALVPHVQGWMLFKKEKHYTPIGWEKSFAIDDLKVCGTPDNWGYTDSGIFTLPDLKSWKSRGATPTRASELQTAGYEIMLRQAKIVIDGAKVQRYIVKLPGNGKYRAYLCEKPLDQMYVHHACTVWWDLRNHRLMGIPEEADNAAAIE